ncbi:MAG: HEAT repeat domain-containing protein [Verrucomicrobiae bacterium]|nr:HEAT repeat domain-containing protein [Verrucomicrobiae bacterium]
MKDVIQRAFFCALLLLFFIPELLGGIFSIQDRPQQGPSLTDQELARLTLEVQSESAETKRRAVETLLTYFYGSPVRGLVPGTSIQIHYTHKPTAMAYSVLNQVTDTSLIIELSQSKPHKIWALGQLRGLIWMSCKHRGEPAPQWSESPDAPIQKKHHASIHKIVRKHVNDPSEIIRSLAFQCLLLLPGQKTDLASFLKDPSWMVRSNVWSRAKAENHTAGMDSCLIRDLDTTNESLYDSACVYLSQVRYRIQYLEKSQPRHPSLKKLKQLMIQAKPIMVRWGHYPNPFIANNTLRVLSYYPDSEVQILNIFLTAKDSHIRFCALEQLENIGTQTTLTALEKSLLSG